MAPTLGEVLADARRTRGLSLRDVERETGIHNAHLSQIENGHIAQPGVPLLYELSELYGIDYAKLLRLAGLAGNRTTSDRSLAGAAFRAVGDLTPGQQEEAIAYLEKLRAQRPPRRKADGG